MTERAAYQAGVPCWVDVLAPDPNAAMAFYGEVLGWEFDGPGPGEYFEAQLRGQHMAGVGAQPDGVPTGWNTYVSVESAEQAAEAAAAAGGRVSIPPFDALPAGRVAVLADPTGAAICVWEPRARQGARLVNEASAWAMSVLHTGKPEVAEAFYKDVFGWESEPFGPPGMALFRLPGYVGGVPGQPVPLDVVAVMAPGAGESVLASRLLGRRRRRGRGKGDGAGRERGSAAVRRRRDAPGNRGRHPRRAVLRGHRAARPLSYFKSAEVLPSSCRATISSWICWVPSKMSRIFDVARPLLQQLALAVADGAAQLDAAQRDVGAGRGRPWPWPSRPAASWACRCRPSTPPAASAAARPPSRPPCAMNSRRGGGLGVGRAVVVDLDAGVARAARACARGRRGRRRSPSPATSGRRVVERLHHAGEARAWARSPALPSRFSLGTRQSSSAKSAVSEARMPSLCSSRSSFRPGLSRSTTNDLIAARPWLAVERRPHHDQLGAVAGGDEDLLAVEHVLVAVERARSCGSPPSRSRPRAR